MIAEVMVAKLGSICTQSEDCKDIQIMLTISQLCGEVSAVDSEIDDDSHADKTEAD